MDGVCDMLCDKPRVKHLKQRNGWWHYERRVPKRYSHLVSAPTVRRSLQTDSVTEAARRVYEVNREVEAEWAALLDASQSAPEKRLGAIAAIAEGQGFQYRTASDLAQKATLTEILSRTRHLERQKAKATEAHVAALLGGVEQTSLPLSQVLDLYYEFTESENLSKSAEQLRRHRNPREKVMSDLIRVVGDRGVETLSRDDLLVYRRSLADQIKTEVITAATANKYISYLAAILRNVTETKGLPEIGFAKLKFKAGPASARPPFSNDEIRRLLAEGALEGLNAEARRAVYAMVETGMRPSEIVNIAPENICLNEAIPFVRIAQASKRRLKTHTSVRQVPLVGCSLAAFREQPEGFPRYRDGERKLSSLINKFMRNRGLFVDDKSLYSLRHSFEDRMIEAGADERMRCELMGHRYNREKYGKGPSLKMKQDLLARMSFQAPASV